MNNITNTVSFSILTTILFLMIPNKSNFPKEIIIPILVAGITKYSLGDWDKKFKWTKLDILYWITILAVSFLTIYIRNKLI
jgi:hypothetical protein